MTFPGNRPKADMRSLNPPLAVRLVDLAECTHPTSVSLSIKPGDSTLVLSNKPSVCYSFKLYRCRPLELCGWFRFIDAILLPRKLSCLMFRRLRAATYVRNAVSAVEKSEDSFRYIEIGSRFRMKERRQRLEAA